jgi:hypothetical protein
MVRVEEHEPVDGVTTILDMRDMLCRCQVLSVGGDLTPPPTPLQEKLKGLMAPKEISSDNREERKHREREE